MKKVVKHIRHNATDEQKLFYAFIASASVLATLAFLWIASFGTRFSSLYDPSANIANKDAEQLEQNTQNSESQKASAIDSLKTTFYELRNSDSKSKQQNKTDFKRQPVEIQI